MSFLLLQIIIFSPDVVMLNRFNCIYVLRPGLPIESILQNRFYVFKGISFQDKRPVTSCFQTLWRIMFGQSHNAQTRTEALFGMFSALENLGNQSCGFSTILTGPINDPGWRPFQILLMSFGHMFF